ncbi:UDP-Glycosyltransferase superfamily protein [Wolffia australiana]
MMNMAADSRPSTSATAEKAISFISKGWREVRDSADADLRLIRARANSFKKLATSFDRELENFLNSASSFSVSGAPVTMLSTSTSIPELEFVKKIQPKLSEFRRAYSSPDFSKKVFEKWTPRGRIKIDLSAIKNALVSVGEVEEDVLDLDRKRVIQKASDEWWKVGQGEEGKEWEPIRKLKTGIKEFELKGPSNEIFENFKRADFMERVKLILKSMPWDTLESKDVPALDASELLAYLIKQSGPIFDQLGLKRVGQDIRSDDLDSRISCVLQSTGHNHDGGPWADPSKANTFGDDGKRHVAIVTTASLPWMTGTAVNPLFRAAFMAKSGKQNVTLLVPWLCKSDQELVYPNNLTFDSPEEQEAYIRMWLEERVGFKSQFKISFYPGKFQKERRSILPAGDTSHFIPSKEADIAILEEPEHLNWYHHGQRWTDKFNYVVGVVHTNYLEYIKREKNGALQAFLVKHINNWVTRAHCHKVLRLSAATQDLPKSVICNVHGVNPKFLKVGEKMAAERELGNVAFSKGAYFLGKMVWAKGYREMIDLLSKHKTDLDGFKIDVFGHGEDADEVQSTARRLSLNINFLKGRDHADDSLHSYKVFINPSVSDVLCTATAEALAMGKFVVCADHPSNEFFKSFPNCLTYRSSEDFVSKVKQALAAEPQPLTAEQRHDLSWDAATWRFVESAELDGVLASSPQPEQARSIKKSASLPDLTQVLDGGLAFAHYWLTGNEALRLCSGAVPGTRDYSKQHCIDLHLLPPHVQNPVYGW